MSGYWSKSLCSKGVGHFEGKFQGELEVAHQRLLATEKRVSGLSRDVVCVILRLAVLVQYRRVTDGRTNGRTDDDG